MALIDPNKKYKRLATFGCSFTRGHHLGHDGAWGHFLSNRLNCTHINVGGGQSNTNILTNVINFCEHNDMTDVCVGIQWSEPTRREFWRDENNWYFVFGPETLLDDSPTFHEFKFIRNNSAYFASIWFNLKENVLRTVLAMKQATGYLKSKNIDFVMFEGFNPIKDENFDDVNTAYELSSYHNLSLLNKEVIMSIYNEKTFFKELGSLSDFMRAHPNWNSLANDGHPHPEILETWTNVLFDYIKKN